ncbi:polysaccharide export protein EpsE [Afipia felis]|uniref:Polysaccharide export protein EpsE n=1 Tax=Afipia felis TaxID=1035 RepID=A0A090MQD9_AFIFE|nr:polysaccharide biosynthesis/export family protein [Afipia felis]MBE0704830.1 polysaccharide biosynthesis/export family protein [Afipia sp.]CEG09605.1 polysaccharide export protein EpsE [Afipia felis]
MSTVRLSMETGSPRPRKIARLSCFGLLLFAAAMLCAASPAKADYRLHVGDVIEISVARAPELKQRVPVQLDGSISFPMMGNLPVAGLTPAEAQSRIQAILATKVFRQRLSDGRDNEIMIDHDEVTATVVEYRPIYVNGDVSKPGEYAYRPLMTVRQAVALSGGYELMRYRMQNPVLEAADLRAEYESLWAEFAKEQALVWRLKTELGEDKHLNQSSLKDLPLKQSTISEIVHVEAEQLKARQADYDSQKAFLQRAIVLGDKQVDVLTEQQKQDDEGAQADIDELQRALEFYGKGALPSPRVADSRRAVLMSSTRKLQTSAQLMQIKQQQSDFTRQLGKLDDQRKMDLLKDLQDANVKLAEVRAKLQSTSEKLQYATLVRSQFVRGGGQPEIVVIRMDEKGQTRIRANEESELQPGDVVEVTLRPGQTDDQREP